MAVLHQTDHRARTLWPSDTAKQEKIARRENVELAHEGEIVHLSC